MTKKVGLNYPSVEGFSVQELRNKSSVLQEFITTQSEQSLYNRWSSFQNHTSDDLFFQGFSEVMGYKSLIDLGWKFASLSADEKTIRIRSPQGVLHQFLSVPLLHQRNYKREREFEQQLVHNLNQLSSPHQIGMLIREPLHEEQDWVELCTGLGNWLNLPSTTKNSFAYMRKNNPKTWLEFGVTNQREAHDRVVLFSVKPILSSVEWHTILNNIQLSLLALDSSIPTIITITSDKISNITPNHILALLYGAVSGVFGEINHRQYSFDNSLHHGFFKDMDSSNVQSIVYFQPDKYKQEKELGFSSHTFTNPTSKPQEVPTPFFAKSGQEESFFQWFDNP